MTYCLSIRFKIEKTQPKILYMMSNLAAKQLNFRKTRNLQTNISRFTGRTRPTQWAPATHIKDMKLSPAGLLDTQVFEGSVKSGSCWRFLGVCFKHPVGDG